jgi:hypothetical protein
MKDREGGGIEIEIEIEVEGEGGLKNRYYINQLFNKRKFQHSYTT